jgi:hypothetical protein
MGVRRPEVIRTCAPALQRVHQAPGAFHVPDATPPAPRHAPCFGLAAMDTDPIVEAIHLAGVITELLQRTAAVAPHGHEQSEVRYAEALARTLFDQLAGMRRSHAA